MKLLDSNMPMYSMQKITSSRLNVEIADGPASTAISCLNRLLNFLCLMRKVRIVQCWFIFISLS